MSQYFISDDNPNDLVGGGGTLTSGEQKSEDDIAPFVIFPASSTDSNISPHCVLSAKVIEELYRELYSEPVPIDAAVIEIPESDIEEIPDI